MAFRKLGLIINEMAENLDFPTYFDGSVQFPISAVPETVVGIHGKVRGHMSD
jgi:hypothetical protein